jgi:hypothetical protein
MKRIATLCTITLLLITSLENAHAQTVNPWQIKTGNEIIKFATATDAQRKEAFGKANIPAKNDAGWASAKVTNGKVDFTENSRLRTCKTELDFTFFQTIVNVPGNVKINTFTVSFDLADDGARLYFFNSKYPQGQFDPNADIISKTEKREIDLKNMVTSGENRIVIVQYDNCATKNNIQGIHVKLNGQEIKVAPATPPVTAPVNDAITVYDGKNYTGKSKTFGVGEHDITQTEFNDIISSLKVTSGYKVTLFRDWRSTGPSVRLNTNTPDLVKFDFNDKASSIKVEKL